MHRFKVLTTVLIMAAAFGIAGCGGGGGGTAEEPPAPMPTPEEMCADAGNHWVDGACLTPSENTVRMALAAIAAATTAEAAQAAYDAVKADVSAADGETLQAAVNARVAYLAKMARADAQKMDLMTAAGNIDTSDLSTQEKVDAARMAIAALRGALAAAAGVSDADKAMYMSTLDSAVAAVDAAQGGIDTATRRTNQMSALSSASTALQAALAALSGSTPTQAQLDAANTALTALNDAIAAGADLTDEEKATYQREATNAAAPISTAQAAKDKADADKDKADNAAMAVTAAKFYDGIQRIDRARLVGNLASDGTVTVAYLDSGFNEPEATTTLSEDEDATVADNHGWKGKKYTGTRAPGTDTSGYDGTYEAVFYGNVEAPTEGNKFGQPGVTTAATGYQYGLNADGEYSVDTSAADAPARVAGPSFDHSAGTKTFELPDNTVRVVIPGSYHGVSGTYYCTPTGGGTDCSASKAASGFTLAGGTWTFKASDNEARVTEMADTNYLVYGWWTRKSADGETLNAGAQTSTRGTVPSAAGITALRGTATYVGGAAGVYALRSSTGGTNDAGSFTARATIEADFHDDKITGTIDNFTGADGESRDWSVEFMEQGVSDIGRIQGDDGTGGAYKMTKWTIGGTAADASGLWLGWARDNGDDGVPKVIFGKFNAEYGTAGKMVGAFGTNKQ